VTGRIINGISGRFFCALGLPENFALFDVPKTMADILDFYKNGNE
jgi:hypothetical protein